MEGRVGHLEEAGEFGLGRAPREAKPVIKIELSKEKEAEIAAMGHYEEAVETNDEIIQQEEEAAMLQRMRKGKRSTTERRAAIDRQVAFLEFKETEAAKDIQK